MQNFGGGILVVGRREDKSEGLDAVFCLFRREREVM